MGLSAGARRSKKPTKPSKKPDDEMEEMEEDQPDLGLCALTKSFVQLFLATMVRGLRRRRRHSGPRGDLSKPLTTWCAACCLGRRRRSAAS